MSAQGSTGKTRVLLSFSGAYTELARQINDDLRAANIDVRYDQWKGGGGEPATPAVANSVHDVAFVVPLLTPSDATKSWIGDEWIRTIYDAACARGIGVLPVRGAGELDAIPEFLRNRSFADLRARDYDSELRRLIETIHNLTGDDAIVVPAVGRAADRTGSGMTLPVNPIVLEVANELAPLIEVDEGPNLLLDELVPMMRDGLFYELGVQYPGLEVRVGAHVQASSARILINGIPEVGFVVHPDAVVFSDTVAAMAKRGFTGERAVNLATGMECTWISADQVEAAMADDLTTWDAREFLILSLSAILRRKAAQFIGLDEVRAMLEQIEPVFPQLIAETVPKTVPLFLLTDVLQRLVDEEISIRDLRRILLAIADWGRVERDPGLLTEYVRAALKRYITTKLSRGQKQLVVFLLDPVIETSIRESIRYTQTGCYVDMDSNHLRKIVEAIREGVAAIPEGYQMPPILVPMGIRAPVRRLVAPAMPNLFVISYHEVSPDAEIQPCGRIELDGFKGR